METEQERDRVRGICAIMGAALVICLLSVAWLVVFVRMLPGGIQ